MSNVLGEVKLQAPATGRALLTLPGQSGLVRFARGAALLTADLAGRSCPGCNSFRTSIFQQHHK